MEHQSTQFKEWREMIEAWHKYHKDTSPGTTSRLKQRFEKYEFDYYKLLAEYRKTKKHSLLRRAEQIHAEAAAEIKTFKRLELLGTLSK